MLYEFLSDYTRSIAERVKAEIEARGVAGIAVEIDESRVSESVYVILKHETSDEIESESETFKIRISNHGDRYGSDARVFVSVDEIWEWENEDGETESGRWSELEEAVPEGWNLRDFPSKLVGYDTDDESTDECVAEAMAVADEFIDGLADCLVSLSGPATQLRYRTFDGREGFARCVGKTVTGAPDGVDRAILTEIEERNHWRDWRRNHGIEAPRAHDTGAFEYADAWAA